MRIPDPIRNAGALAAAFLLLPLFLVVLAQPAAAGERIVMQLRWHHQFQFAGYYAAKEQGYYRDAGLDVAIVPGGPGRVPVEEVLSGRAQYGEANSELLFERLKGQPLVALASIFQHSPSVLLVRADSSIRSPHDLVGRKVMVIGNETDADLLAMMRNEGVNLSDVHLQNSSYDINDLVSGKTDAFNSYLTNEPYFMQEKGIETRALNPINYGIDFYTDVLFTTEDEIKNHPDRVQKFRDASLRGWEYAMAHQDEMIDLIRTKYGSPKTRAHLAFEADAMEKLILPKYIELGHMNPGRWRHMAETFKREGMVESTAQLDGFLYDPHSPTDVAKWQRTVRIMAVVLVVAGALSVIVIYVNVRLNRAVAARTTELSRSVESERRANRVKSDLLANMSHELRTPLNAILGFSEAMRLGINEELGPKNQEYADIIFKSGQHLLALVNDILDVSALQDSKTTLHEEPLDVAGVARDCLLLIASKADEGGVSVVDEVCPDLPRLRGDERRIKQVLLNLLSNAVKFTKPGGRVVLKAEIEDGCHVLSVSDTGIGMTPDEIEIALTKFGQVESGMSRSYEGAGLGVPLTKGLVELHGGTLSITSEKGAGTTVSATFPAERTVG